MGTRRQDIQKLLINKNRRLQVLREQQALKGVDTPPHTILEIQDLQAEIERLEQELNTLKPEKPVPPASKPKLHHLWIWGVTGGLGLILLMVIIIGGIYFSQIAAAPATPTSTCPAKMPDDGLDIAVAGFAQADQVTPANTGQRFAQAVTNNLNETFASIDRKFKVTVWGPDCAGSIIGTTTAEQKVTAAKIAEQVGADIVVYGTIEANYTLLPKFALSTDKFEGFSEVEEIMGEQGIGTPLQIAKTGDFVDQDRETQKLAIATAILSNMVLGLGNYYHSDPDYQRALALFETANQHWPSQNGKHILYVLMGNTAGQLEDYDGAIKYYQQATELEPNYPNAYLGLANTYLVQATDKLRHPEPAATPTYADVDREKLNLAIDTFEKAKTVAPDLPVPDVNPKADFHLGEAYVFLAGATGDQSYFKQAADSFRDVIVAYAGGKQPGLKGFARESYAWLGVLAQQKDDSNCALKQYQQALSLTRKDNTKKINEYQQKIEALQAQGADANQCSP